MSAVFGVVRWDGQRLQLDHIEKMKSGLAPRSPDGFCVWQEGNVVFSRPPFFTFASTPEALTVLPDVSAAPNDEFIASVLVPYEWDTGRGRTWQEDVSVLNAAETAVATAGNLAIHQYWQMDSYKQLILKSTEEYIECFWENFDRSVARRIHSDNVSLALSGGMDSATIVASLQRQRISLPGYSVVTEDKNDFYRYQFIVEPLVSNRLIFGSVLYCLLFLVGVLVE